MHTKYKKLINTKMITKNEKFNNKEGYFIGVGIGKSSDVSRI